MKKQLKKFLETKFKSQARIVDSKIVEVKAPDGEVFQIISHIGIYDNNEYQTYQLRLIESIFDKCYNVDKELMTNNIWREVTLNAVSFMGMNSGDRQQERVRIGGRIRQIREDRNIEARELARLADIDAANLSRIENGRYSVGIDILSRIAAALGKKIDLVDI